jgi:hypothetical protein
MATFTTAEMVVGTLTLFQRDGVTPAVVDGVPVWASSDETVIRATVNADGMGGNVEGVAEGGPARIVVTCDADMGAGFIPVVITSEDVTVTRDTSQQAFSGTLTFGPPVPKTPVTPTP